MTFKNRIANFFGREPQTRSGGYLTINDFFRDSEYCEGYTRLTSVPEVMTCVNVISSMVSNMTIHQMKNTPEGDVRIIDGLSRKVDIDPYMNMTRKQWVEWIVKSMLIHGNAYVYPTYKEDLIDELILIPFDKIRIERTQKGYYYVFNEKRIYPDEILHFTYNVDPDDPFMGRGLTVELKDLVSTLKSSSKIRSGFMKDEFKPSVIIYVDGMTDDLTTEEGREKVKNKIGAKIKAGEPFVVEDQIVRIEQVKPLTLKDLAIAEGIEMDRRQTASLFGVPSYYMGLGPFNKDEHNNFVKTTIRNISETIAQVLTKGLILSPERYFRLNPRSLMSYSVQEIATLGSTLGPIGFIVGNEIRDDLGLPPLEGLSTPVILENYIPVDKIGDQKKLLGGEDE